MVVGQLHNKSQSMGFTDPQNAHEYVIPSNLGIQIIGFTVMVSVCSVFGTLGNIPVLLVYCKKRDKRTANTFIKVLAVIDLIVCAIIMPYTIVYELHLVRSDVACRLLEFLRHLTVSASNLTLVAIAVERYVAVCVIRHKLTVRNVNLGMCIVIATSAVMAAPSMGMFAAVTKEDLKDVNCSFPHINLDDNARFCHFTMSIIGPVLSRTYQAGLMLFFFLTFIVIVVFYSIVYTALWKRAKRRSRQSVRTDIDAESSVSLDKKRSAASLQEFYQDGMQIAHNGCAQVLHENSVSSMDDPAARVAASYDRRGWERNSKDLVITPSPNPRRTANRNVRVHRRTARMLFLCSVVFLVTWLPFWVDVFSNTHNLCLRYLFFIGNASNPLVYGIANSQFRRSLVKVLVSYRPSFGGTCK